MTTEVNPSQPADRKVDVQVRGGSPDTVYALGIIGAWVYYVGRAVTPRDIATGVLKGFVWPAFLVHDLLAYLHKD